MDTSFGIGMHTWSLLVKVIIVQKYEYFFYFVDWYQRKLRFLFYFSIFVLFDNWIYVSAYTWIQSNTVNGIHLLQSTLFIENWFYSDIFGLIVFIVTLNQKLKSQQMEKKTKIPYKNCVWFYIIFNIIPIIKFREENQVTTDHENVVQKI